MVGVLPVLLLCAKVVYSAVTQPLPTKQVGLYVLLADDTVKNYTTSDVWIPELADWQKKTNVLYFTFVNPLNMTIPPAFSRLASTIRKNTNQAPRPTIMFAIGGALYSNKPWPWLASVSAAEAMAVKVSHWPEEFGCDGIDLDLETGAGSGKQAAANVIAFIRKLNSLRADMVVTQPVFGYPDVTAETAIVNSAFGNNSQIAVDAVGIMVYQGAECLQYVKNYENGTTRWQGFPVHVDVPASKVACGINGAASNGDLEKFVGAANDGLIRGVMVWYSSVIDSDTGLPAIQYAGGAGDASNKDTTSIWPAALTAMSPGRS